jgi:hypothetical protein
MRPPRRYLILSIIISASTVFRRTFLASSTVTSNFSFWIKVEAQLRPAIPAPITMTLLLVFFSMLEEVLLATERI